MIDERRAVERRSNSGRRQGEKLPYMPLYVDEWDSSRFVQRLTFEGQGIYLTLMRDQWRDGSIPSEEAAVRELLGLPETGYPALSYLLDAQFPRRGKRRMNLKLARLRRAALAKCKQARTSAHMRWQSERIAKALPTQSEGNAKKLRENTTNTGNDDEPIFDEHGNSAILSAMASEYWPKSRGKRS